MSVTVPMMRLGGSSDRVPSQEQPPPGIWGLRPHPGGNPRGSEAAAPEGKGPAEDQPRPGQMAPAAAGSSTPTWAQEPPA